MKIHVNLIFLILMFYGIVEAQTDKSSILIGGNARMQFQGNVNVFMLPQAGFFVSKNFCIGTSLPLALNKSENSTGYRIGIGPFFRSYIGNNKFKGVFEGGISMVTDHSTYSNGNNAIKSSATDNSAHLAGGLTYFLNRNIGVEGLLNYLIDNDFEAGSKWVVKIGFQIHINRKAIE